MFSFKSPTTISVTGNTCSGKSTFVRRLLENKDCMFNPTPDKVLYAYGIWQSAFNNLEQSHPFIQLHEGVPSIETIKSFAENNRGRLVVLDDLMHEVLKNRDMDNLFCRCAHHLGITIIYVTQNMFCSGRWSRNINLNTHYMVLMKSLRDVNQIKVLAQQTGMGNLLTEAYADVHSEPYAYLVVDLSPTSCDDFRLMTKIFPGELPLVYKKKAA